MKKIIGIALLVLLLINIATAQDLIGHLSEQGQITLNYQPPTGGTGLLYSVTWNWFYYNGSDSESHPTQKTNAGIQFVIHSTDVKDYVYVNGKQYSKADVTLVNKQYPKGYSWETHVSRVHFAIKTDYGSSGTHGTLDRSYKHAYDPDFDGFYFVTGKTTASKPLPFPGIGNPQIISYGEGTYELKNVLRLKQKSTQKTTNSTTSTNINSNNTNKPDSNSTESSYNNKNITQATNSSFQAQATDLKKAKSVEYTNKGNQFYNNGSYDEAEMYWEKALKLAPNNQAAKNNIAQLKNIQNSNAQIMAQSQQRANNFNAQQQNIQQSSENIANNLADGSPNAVGQAGVATAKLLAESGAGYAESMLGGAGVVAIGSALLGSGKSKSVGKLEFENGIYQGEIKGDFAHGNGVKRYNAGWIFNGKWINNYKIKGISTFPDGFQFSGKYRAAGGNKMWLVGEITTPDKKWKLDISYYDEYYTSQRLSYIFNEDCKVIWRSSADYNYKLMPYIKFSNEIVFTFNSSDEHDAYYGNLNGKCLVKKKNRTCVSTSKPKELVKNIIEAGGKKHLPVIAAILGNHVTDEKLKSTYFNLALDHTKDEDIKKQIVELKDHPIIIEHVKNRWLRHAFLCKSDNYKNLIKNDYAYNIFRTIEYYGKNRPQLARKHVDKAISACYGNNQKIAKCNSIIGDKLISLKQYDEAEDYLLKSLKFSENHYRHISLSHSYFFTSNYPKCIEHSRLAIEIASKGNKKDIEYAASCHYFIALSYLLSNKYEKSKEVFLKARKINKKKYLENVTEELKILKAKGLFTEEIDYIISKILK